MFVSYFGLCEYCDSGYYFVFDFVVFVCDSDVFVIVVLVDYGNVLVMVDVFVVFGF